VGGFVPVEAIQVVLRSIKKPVSPMTVSVQFSLI
jgi:hypothetical protein